MKDHEIKLPPAVEPGDLVMGVSKKRYRHHQTLWGLRDWLLRRRYELWQAQTDGTWKKLND